MNPKGVTYKGFLVISLVVSVFSVLLPWVTEKAEPQVYIPEQLVRYIGGKFWSYQAIIEVYVGAHAHAFSLWFQGYWYYYEFLAGWMLVLVFQVLMVATGALSTVKEEVRGYPLPLITAFSASAVSLILGYCQFLKHSAAGRDFNSVSVDIGFALALFSVALWLVSLLIYVRSSRETLH